jgi:hypothetical protein
MRPLKIAVPKTVNLPMPREESGTWSCERLADMRKGDIYHEILANIRYHDEVESLRACVQQVLNSARTAYDVTEILLMVNTFITHPLIAPWFEKQPERHVLQEKDFVDRDGTLYRPDRIIIDRNHVTVIDFKMGVPRAHYEMQVKRYMDIMTQLYPDKKVKGFLAFIDSQSIQEIM